MALSFKALAASLLAPAALAAVGAATAQTATATADPGCPLVADNIHLIADATQPGVISLRFYDAGSERVVFMECLGTQTKRLGARRNPPGTPKDFATPTRFDDAVTWSCERRTRRFSAYAKLPDGSLEVGTYSVRTPSCANRFQMQVPRRVAPGSTAPIRIVDRWGIGGLRPELCVTPPRATQSCNRVALARAVTIVTRRLRATTPGNWRIELRVGDHRTRAEMTVGKGKAGADEALPTLLATGDSTMMGLDSFLGDELGDLFDVRSDVRLGSALSRTPFWPDHAVSQARKWRPSVTVMSVGAAFDGSPMTTPAGETLECCEQPWVLEYARRVRGMMQTYARGGHARVYWLTVPLPRLEIAVPIALAVNRAAVIAGNGTPGATVVRIDQVFTPHGYQESIRFRGRDVDVREADGIHLNVSGTAISAAIVARAIRATMPRTNAASRG
jgi:hypothetical protein